MTLPILFGAIYKLNQLIDFGSSAAANSLLVFTVTTYTVILFSSAAHLFHSKSIDHVVRIIDLIYILMNIIIVLFILYKYRNVIRSDKHVK